MRTIVADEIDMSFPKPKYYFTLSVNGTDIYLIRAPQFNPNTIKIELYESVGHKKGADQFFVWMQDSSNLEDPFSNMAIAIKKTDCVGTVVEMWELTKPMLLEMNLSEDFILEVLLGYSKLEHLC